MNGLRPRFRDPLALSSLCCRLDGVVPSKFPLNDPHVFFIALLPTRLLAMVRSFLRIISPFPDFS
jgi:hypothetical protein